jgi:hypothetical protein
LSVADNGCITIPSSGGERRHTPFCTPNFCPTQSNPRQGGR